MKVRFLAPIFRYFLGLLFISTGIGKLLDNRGFAQVIASYKLGFTAWFSASHRPCLLVSGVAGLALICCVVVPCREML